jgi:hypothetical protein
MTRIPVVISLHSALSRGSSLYEQPRLVSDIAAATGVRQKLRCTEKRFSKDNLCCNNPVTKEVPQSADL